MQQLKSHSEEHKKNPNLPFATRENPRPFRCLECDTGFRTKFHLSRHFKSRLHIYKLEEMKIIPQGTYGYVEDILNTLDSYSSQGFLKLLMENLKERNLIEKLEESEKLVSEMRRRRSSLDVTAMSAAREETGDNEVFTSEGGYMKKISTKIGGQDVLQRKKSQEENRKNVAADIKTEIQIGESVSKTVSNTNRQSKVKETIAVQSMMPKSTESLGMTKIETDASGMHLCVICNRGFINVQHLKVKCL